MQRQQTFVLLRFGLDVLKIHYVVGVGYFFHVTALVLVFSLCKYLGGTYCLIREK